MLGTHLGYTRRSRQGKKGAEKSFFPKKRTILSQNNGQKLRRFALSFYGIVNDPGIYEEKSLNVRMKTNKYKSELT